MARKVRKPRHTASTGLDWLGMPAGLMKDKVKVSPLRAASVVKGPRPGRVGFTRKKSNPVMLGRQRFTAKSSMAGIAAAVA